MPQQTSTSVVDVMVNRRTAFKALAATGIGSAVFQRAMAAQVAPGGAVTSEMIDQAQWIAGLSLSEEEREKTAAAVNGLQKQLDALRETEVDYFTSPAIQFRPLEMEAPLSDRPIHWPIERPAPAKPETADDLAFLSVSELSPLVKSRQVSSMELTRLYLDRLKKHDSALLCVVNFTEATALEQAERADREIAAGDYRGPLHGIPWGAKDIIAWPGYPTTWGAKPFEKQTFDFKATVAQRLEEAGAVLVAKLSVGALAWGDQWFKGTTKNPWNSAEGSSGSSAGSASAAAAGLVGFALGSETLGSIVSPCVRCGATGLRPTFGRVSRHGCMPLAWSMDKIGPIARSVEDCALIFGAIHGADGRDPTAVTRPFDWPSTRELSSLTVGYFENTSAASERDDLRALKELGVRLTPIELPTSLPHDALTIVLGIEATSVFDRFVRDGELADLGLWPNTFRRSQFVPAMEYLRAQRLRSMLMRQMEEVMRPLDAYIGGDDLVIANLTGHPTVVMPGAMTKRKDRDVPAAVTFTGKLFGESALLALAHAWQRASGFHKARPKL